MSNVCFNFTSRDIAYATAETAVTGAMLYLAIPSEIETAFSKTGIHASDSVTITYDPEVLSSASRSFTILAESLLCATVFVIGGLTKKTISFVMKDFFTSPLPRGNSFIQQNPRQPSRAVKIASKAAAHGLGIGSQAALVAAKSGMCGYFVRLTQHITPLPCWIITERGEEMRNSCAGLGGADHLPEQIYADPGTVAKVLEAASPVLLWKVIVPTGLGVFVVSQIPTCFPSVASKCSQLMASAASWISSVGNSIRNRLNRPRDPATWEELDPLVSQQDSQAVYL